MHRYGAVTQSRYRSKPQLESAPMWIRSTGVCIAAVVLALGAIVWVGVGPATAAEVAVTKSAVATPPNTRSGQKQGPGLHLTRHTDAYWRVTVDLPPLNIFGPKNIAQLEEIVSLIETDEKVKVVVFDSAIEGFFLTHWDFFAKPEESAGFKAGKTGLQPLPDLLARLSRAPVVSIAMIRGRATGVGSELALASDLRFASREKAILSQWEVGAGLIPGGGPMARLPRLIGRGRALEVLLGSDDINGSQAELYGYVNRALPDAELDQYVDRLARRIASFDKSAIAATKHLVDLASLPPDADIAKEWPAFEASVGRPEFQKRLKELLARGFHRPGEVESKLGYYLGQLGN